MVGDTYREKKLTLVTVGSRSFLKLERVDLESVAYRKLFQAGGDSAGNDAYDRGWIDSGHLFDTPYDVIVINATVGRRLVLGLRMRSSEVSRSRCVYGPEN